jgi:hypothetical protein
LGGISERESEELGPRHRRFSRVCHNQPLVAERRERKGETLASIELLAPLGPDHHLRNQQQGIDMDLEYASKRLMAALEGIAAGKTHEEFVAVRGYGQSSKIFDALNDAAKHLNEPFHADDLDTVDQAFTKLGLVRTSDRKNDAANAVLKALIR